MPKRPTARDLERAAAADPPRRRAPPRPDGEAVAMLLRRGFEAKPSPPDLPFPPDLAAAVQDCLADRLGHYAFRLFLRGAIQRPLGFLPREATRYLKPEAAGAMARSLVELGLLVPLGRGRYRLAHPARSFGGALEWYVGRELERRYGFDVATGLKLRAAGVGGDLDVVAAAEGKLVYVELKSSPPRHLQPAEVGAFLARVRALRPDVAVFAMDTALRLSDKVLPMLRAGLLPAATPRRVVRELWALTPHLYVANARHDLVANIGRAIGCGLRALAPPAP